MTSLCFPQVPETDEEALYLLELAYTQRAISKLKRILVGYQLKESIYQTHLLDIQVKRAQQGVDEADVRVGNVRSALRGNSFSVHGEGHLEHEGLIFLNASWGLTTESVFYFHFQKPDFLLFTLEYLFLYLTECTVLDISVRMNVCQCARVNLEHVPKAQFNKYYCLGRITMS